MSRLNKGWVKLYRQDFEEDLGCNAYLWAIWNTLLLWAHWKPSKILWEGKPRELPPGSVLFGYDEIANKWGISKSVVQKWVKYLHKTQKITLESCPRGSLATICNYELYLTSNDEACTQQNTTSIIMCSNRVHKISPQDTEIIKNNDHNKNERGHNVDTTWTQRGPYEEVRNKNRIYMHQIIGADKYNQVLAIPIGTKGSNNGVGQSPKDCPELFSQALPNIADPQPNLIDLNPIEPTHPNNWNKNSKKVLVKKTLGDFGEIKKKLSKAKYPIERPIVWDYYRDQIKILRNLEVTASGENNKHCNTLLDRSNGDVEFLKKVILCFLNDNSDFLVSVQWSLRICVFNFDKYLNIAKGNAKGPVALSDVEMFL